MGTVLKPRIAISGVNLVEAGPLSVFQDALQILAGEFSAQYEIVALVHDRALFSAEPVTYLEYPEVKSSWLKRLWFEYVTCRRLSRQVGAFLWLALHDMTPNVEATVQAVYCHNPSPFGQWSVTNLRRDWKFAAFVLLYRYLYRINLFSNDYVIVQQQWMRREFQRLYGHPKIVVAHPNVKSLGIPPQSSEWPGVCQFFYPALPRPFKNVEVIVEAVRELRRRQVSGFSVSLTIDGSESSYAAELRASASDLPEIRWLGRISREQVIAVYAESDCLLFPSRLETWGMPLSEFKQTGRPILAADLPYAHEAVGSYDAVRFFPPADARSLADLMEQLIRGELRLGPVVAPAPDQPFAPDWSALFHLLLAEGTAAVPTAAETPHP